MDIEKNLELEKELNRESVSFYYYIRTEKILNKTKKQTSKIE